MHDRQRTRSAAPPRAAGDVRSTSSDGRSARRRLVQLVLAAMAAALLLVSTATAAEEGALAPPADDRPLQVAAVYDIIFPLQTRVAFGDDFLSPRGSGPHHAIDMMAPKMTPILAVTDGTLDWAYGNPNGTKISSYNNKPSFNLMLKGDDGNSYFYIHMNNDTPGTDDGNGGVQYAYAPGLPQTTRVTRGQLLGYVGDSGNAEDAGSHLDFSIHPGGYKNPVNPYESLRAAPTWAEWQAAHGGGPPREAPFIDVNPAEWYYADLVLLYKAEVVKGGLDLRFRPYDPVTRAQFAAYLVRGLAPEALQPAEAPAEAAAFSDVRAGHWAYAEVAAAARLGFVLGVGDGSAFAPNAQISRAQMAAMLDRVAEHLQLQAAVAEPRPFTDLSANYWAAQAIARVSQLGLMGGDDTGRFRPDEASRRAHAIAVIARALRLQDGSAPSS